MIPIDLEGQRALVTGSGAGIGREIAMWLARAGASVVVHDLHADRARNVAAEIGARASVAVADARDDSALIDAVQSCGQLDILVNNVGMLGGRSTSPFVDMDGSYWRDVLDQNLVTTALASATAARSMTRGGVIVNVTSGETTRPSPFNAAYAAAKAAINHLTQTMAVELGPLGIRVNAVAPGTTRTETVAAVFDDAHMDAIASSVPLRRHTEPDELARLVVFLASDLARCITGQLILADAGAFLSRNRPPNRGPE